MPFIRRPGVAVRLPGGDPLRPLLGCIVPHRHGRHGCLSRGRCYHCPGNPFYEVCSGEEILRVRPFLALGEGVIVPPGTSLVLRRGSRELTSVYTTEDPYDAGSSQEVPAEAGIICRLQVPIDLVPVDGLLSVAVRVKRGVMKRIEVLYVKPEDLVVPHGQSDVDKAQQWVFPL